MNNNTELPFGDDLQSAVFAAIRNTPEIVLALKPKYITEDAWDYAISAKPELFRALKNKPYRLCMLAISIDGFNLAYVDPTKYSGEQYSSLCDAAVAQNPKAIAAVPREFQTKRLKAYAFSQDPDLLMSEKKLTPSMIEAIIDHNPSLIRYVVEPTDDMIIRALTHDPRVIVYFDVISNRVKDFFEERYPQYAMLIHD